MNRRPDAPNYSAIVLAAGEGRRFGGRKLLAPRGDGVLLDGALRAALATNAADIIVVTGPDRGEIEAAVRACAGSERRLRFVHAEDYREGMAASLRAGIAAVPAEHEAALILLGDMPRTPPGIVRDLWSALGPQHLAAAPVHRGRRGHPVLIRRALFADIATLRGDRGAGALLGGLGSALALVETDDAGTLFDVDHPGDLDASKLASGDIRE
ncbi:nucleotidyltransferase family protein [Terrihabitans sp. B22-R8]|uniref:nucleotidyltransferase family protein n=1 Tax=Terrihabitans sp. B22-R8 TaxID=3425128 RepID=UPI00403CF697